MFPTIRQIGSIIKKKMFLNKNIKFLNFTFNFNLLQLLINYYLKSYKLGIFFKFIMKEVLNNNYSYYRTDIPAVKQFSNLPRENFSLKTNDLPGFYINTNIIVK